MTLSVSPSEMDMKVKAAPSVTAFKGYFRAPDFLYEASLGLSGIARLVLGYLCRRADKTGKCFPSQERIARDCGLKSPKTVRKALRELVKAMWIHILHDKRLSTCIYQLSEKVLSLLRLAEQDVISHNGQNIPPGKVKNTSDHRQNLPTKEYTGKEDTHKEELCALNQDEIDELVLKWDHFFLDTYSHKSREAPQWVRKNLIDVALKVSDMLKGEYAEDLKNHSLGLIEWYLTANEDIDPSKGNKWVYTGERKSSRLSKNFETVWADYWLRNKPVEEWKPDPELLERRGEVTKERMTEEFDRVRKPKRPKDPSNLNGSTGV